MLLSAAAMLGVAACGSGSSNTASSTAAHTAAASAASCLSGSLSHSARLDDSSVDVSPAPGSRTANPHSQISFLGAPAKEIRSVTVSGSASGAHAGRLRAYTQGDGASFVPDKPFAAGETVEVRARIGAGKGSAESFAFRVDSPGVDRKERAVRQPCRRTLRLPGFLHAARCAGPGPHRHDARPRHERR